MAGSGDKFVTPGRHTRRPERAGLRRLSVAALIMLVVQYGLGIFLNLYVAIPASDAHAGIFTEIATAPVSLTVHALLGLALVGTAIRLVARAVGMGDRQQAVLAAAGLTAIGGAFGAGEIFVKNGQATASLAMAALTGVALLCYVGMLALATVAQGQAIASARPAPVPVRAPRPRAPMTPPTAWPATPSRGVPARENWEDRQGRGERQSREDWLNRVDRLAGENWPPEVSWQDAERWPGREDRRARDDWAGGEGWPEAPRADSGGSWFARG